MFLYIHKNIKKRFHIYESNIPAGVYVRLDATPSSLPPSKTVTLHVTRLPVPAPRNYWMAPNDYEW